MRQSVEDAVMKINEGLVDLVDYAGISCDTCIHKHRHVFEEPCASCSSVLKEDGRDYRTTTKHNWSPDTTTSIKSIKTFLKHYPRSTMEHLQKFPPARCINPICPHGHLVVHRRGLCRGCYKTAQTMVERHQTAANKLLTLASISESSFEFEAAMSEYDLLNTWHSFIVKGMALPEPNDYETPIAKIGMLEYYQAALKNNGENPTRRQLRLRGLSNEQVDRLSELVEVV